MKIEFYYYRDKDPGYGALVVTPSELKQSKLPFEKLHIDHPHTIQPRYENGKYIGYGLCIEILQ
jgi:hypothetical protein